ncbi:PREDICTED: cysteine-rich venom protein helothermine-like [Gekko japonicus]|uniref:Cysteine-rich venom protein helothermine-like n=1 Tax=Gekko japonicus TaxID=146911 RepID=A0ABM1KWF8_GEKJA|nr:PREDICTED: cysteine-rich venom protein helothermine-like [Gekko japonicus]
MGEWDEDNTKDGATIHILRNARIPDAHTESQMILLVLSLCLATELHQYAAEGSLMLDDVMTTHVEQQNEICDKHNALRRQEGGKNMLKMKWNAKIAANAQKYADQCIYEHSPKASRKIDGRNCGENLFMSSTIFPWSYVCESWYNEKKDFVYGVGASPKGAMVGHYTQVVWATTYEMGCGVAYCPNQGKLKYFFVCQYSPAGNVDGKRETPYKKGTPCADCPDHCDQGLCTNPCLHNNQYSNCDPLTKQWGCNHPDLKEECKASCKCTTEIR